MFCRHRVGGVTDIRNWSSSLLDAYFVAYLHKIIPGCDLNCVCPLLESKNKKSRNGVMGVGCLHGASFRILMRESAGCICVIALVKKIYKYLVFEWLN